MPTYEIGSTIRITYRNYDTAGALANPGTSAGTFTLPDGSTTAATITSGGTGIIIASLVTTQAGRHRLQITGTGANTERLPYRDVADVWPTTPVTAISLQDARDELSLPATEVAGDDELRLFIASATDMIEELCAARGLALIPKSRTEDSQPRTETVSTRRTPVGTVTSVTEYSGTTATVIPLAATPGASGDGYLINTDTGILTRVNSGRVKAWQPWVRVVYTWGPTVVSPRAIMATRALVAHLWSIGQRGQRPSFGGDEYTMTPSGYAVPNRVVEILDPTGEGRVSGIA